MSGRIKKLDSTLIDKIAAGEVVENPTSVVKELVENAIDAGSSLITVEVMGGGFQKIRVADNGEGMSRQDALVSIERHATSKLSRLKDLFAIRSMGFRGEALSSIAAVSKFSLLTQPKGSHGVATKLTYQGQLQVSDGVRDQGTTVEVDALFYNTPARKKFQKSQGASTAEMTKLMTKLALAHPHIAFRFYSNGQEVMALHAPQQKSFLDQLQTRIGLTLPSVYGEEGCIVNYKDERIELQGIVGTPTQTRANRLGQYLFINQRSVFSPLISSVVQDLYATRIHTKDHPIFVLHLSLDPTLVDVNVHPQKREVRLSEEPGLMQSLKKAILGALSEREEVKQAPEPIDLSKLQDFQPRDVAMPSSVIAQKESVQERESSFFDEIPPPRLLRIAQYKGYDLVDTQSFNEAFPNFQFEEGMLFIHRSAVAKRIAFDAFYKSLKGEDVVLSRQALLFPISIEVTKDQVLTCSQHCELFDRLGLSMRPFGDHCLVVESLASYFQERDVERLVLDLIPLLERGEIKDKKLKEIAKSATQHVDQCDGDLHTLVEELLKTSAPLVAPSGKPTLSHFSPLEIEKQSAMMKMMKKVN